MNTVVRETKLAVDKIIENDNQESKKEVRERLINLANEMVETQITKECKEEQE